MVDPVATSTKSLSGSSTNQRNGKHKRSHFALSVNSKIGRINSVSNLYPANANTRYHHKKTRAFVLSKHNLSMTNLSGQEISNKLDYEDDN